MVHVLISLFILSLLHATQGEYHCPEGYVIDNNSCYFISNEETATWYQARDNCQKMNATLATILSEEEQFFLKERVRGPRRKSVWIGLHDLIEEDRFTWLNGTPKLNYTNWADGEPNNMEQNCVAISGWLSNRGKWLDEFCRKLYAYVCEKPAGVRGCSEGMTAFAGRCYYFSYGKAPQMTWEAARVACQEMGGDLATVDSMEKNDFIKQNVSRINAWIGLNDKKQEGKWTWLDQTEEASWQYWDYMQPDNGGNSESHCAYMRHRYYRIGKWLPLSCEAHAGFICEKVHSTSASLQDVVTDTPSNISSTPGTTTSSNPCESGWLWNSPNCYLVEPNATTWQDARSYCQSLGADLIVVDSEQEVQFLRGKFVYQTWTGLNDRNHMGLWVWLDQTVAPTWTNWDRGPEPAIDRNRDCVMVHSTSMLLGNWSNVVCNNSHGYICQMEAGEGCPENSAWVQFQDVCYSFNNDATSWTQSRVRCRLQQENADLAQILSREAQAFVNSHITGIFDTNKGGFWIGLRYQRERKQYEWLENSAHLSFTNWGPQEPMRKVDEACVSMKTSWSNRGSWEDQDCFEENGYICKSDALGDSTYFDFKLNNTVYKIVEEKMIQGDAREFCRHLLGENTTLLQINSTEEMQRVMDELYVRFSGETAHSQQTFWVDGSPGTSTNTPDLLPSLHRPTPVPLVLYPRTTTPPGLGKRCQHAKLEYRWENRRWTFSGLGIHASTCCELKSFICERTLSDGSPDYDIMYGGSIYRLSTDVAMRTYDEARQWCENNMDGTGTLLQINSYQEHLMISAELRLRHLGAYMEYWVDGNPNGNTTYTNYTGEVKPDYNCTKLSHAIFPEIDLKKVVMDYFPTKCTGTKRFICERRLDIPDLPEFPTLSAETEPPPKQNTPQPVVASEGSSCQGPCIGLAVALPFVAIIPAVIVAVFLITCRKYQYMGFAFNKASDEVYLTT